MLGSVADYVVHNAHCSVLLVRPIRNIFDENGINIHTPGIGLLRKLNKLRGMVCKCRGIFIQLQEKENQQRRNHLYILVLAILVAAFMLMGGCSLAEKWGQRRAGLPQ